MSRRLEWETARDADPYDAWATITLIVVSLALSVQEFQGAQFPMLMMDPRYMLSEPWRYLSPNVLHVGWLHLIMNVMWTLRLGSLAEAMLGLTGYVLVLLLLAAVSTMAQWAFSGPAVGLSGVGYGLFGLLWALDRWHPRCRGVMSRRTAELFAVWFLFCVFITWQGLMPIGNAAHGGGFVFGALVGWALSGAGARRLTRFAVTAAAFGALAVAQLPPVHRVINPEMYDFGLMLQGADALEAGDEARSEEIWQELLERNPELRDPDSFMQPELDED